MLCWSPLASGILTGKYGREANQKPPSDSRVGIRADIDLPRYWTEKSFGIIDRLMDIAEQVEKTPAQVALAWLLRRLGVAAVVIGARTAAQLQSNLEVADWDLPDALHEQLTAVSGAPEGYPLEWIRLTWSQIAGQEEFPPWDP